jgi:hypothetical protein
VQGAHLTFFAGRKLVEKILFDKIRSWGLRAQRSLELLLVDGSRRRFATVDTVRLGGLLAQLVSAGRLVQGRGATSRKARRQGTPTRTRVRAETPVTARRAANAGAPAPAVASVAREAGTGWSCDNRGYPAPGGDGSGGGAIIKPGARSNLRIAVTQKHLHRAPRDVELVVDSRALRVVSGSEIHEVYSLSGVSRWKVTRDDGDDEHRCELVIEHHRVPSEVRFGCTAEVGAQAGVLLPGWLLLCLSVSLSLSLPPSLSPSLPHTHTLSL